MRSTAGVLAGALTLVAVAVLGPAHPAAAAPAYPAPFGRCVDQVGVLGKDLCAKVTAILLRDEKLTSDEIAVAVVPTTGDATIETWGTGLFNDWGVGKSAKNNGVLLVVAVDDRRVRLVTGRGLAKRLPDRTAGEIVDTAITPLFAQDQYATGILDGLDEVRRRLGHRVAAGARLEPLAAQAPAWVPAPVPEPAVAEEPAVAQEVTVEGLPDGFGLPEGFVAEGEDTGSLPPILPVVLVGAVLAGLMALAMRARGSGSSGDGYRRDDDHGEPSRHHRATHWHSTSSSAGFGSSSDSSSSGSSSSSDFGGGSSSGGGASGSW